jgi:hypothetical protein
VIAAFQQQLTDMRTDKARPTGDDLNAPFRHKPPNPLTIDD